MINVTQIPVATATQQNLLIEITESICEKVCVNSTSSLGGTISFSNGTPTIINGVAIIPVTATGSIVITWPGCPCRSKTIPFVETFDIPFTSTTDNVVTLNQGTSNVVSFVDTRCCKSGKVRLKTTLQAEIA